MAMGGKTALIAGELCLLQNITVWMIVDIPLYWGAISKWGGDVNGGKTAVVIWDSCVYK